MDSTTSNVLPFPKIGQAINGKDQGLYFARNTQTGLVQSIYRLDSNKDWYLHQLHPLADDMFTWELMAAHANDVMSMMPRKTIASNFNRPELAEPKGAWQVLHNSQFGFGKFTPDDLASPVRFAMIPFHQGALKMPVWIEKADESALVQAKKHLIQSLETA